MKQRSRNEKRMENTQMEMEDGILQWKYPSSGNQFGWWMRYWGISYMVCIKKMMNPSCRHLYALDREIRYVQYWIRSLLSHAIGSSYSLVVQPIRAHSLLATKRGRSVRWCRGMVALSEIGIYWCAQGICELNRLQTNIKNKIHSKEVWQEGFLPFLWEDGIGEPVL